jgi:hypothetical protein
VLQMKTSQRIINEFALDLSYSLKLSENSRWRWPEDLLTQILKLHRYNDATSARTFCNWWRVFSIEEVAFTDFNGRWRAGFNIQNLGPKISYDNDQISTNFIPANLKSRNRFWFWF